MNNEGRFSSRIQAPVRKVHFNTEQEIIQITEDKLRLELSVHLDKVKKTQDLVGVVGLFLASLTATTTSTFKDFVISSSKLEAFFFFLTFGSAIWVVVSFYKFCKSPTLNDLMVRIKNESE